MKEKSINNNDNNSGNDIRNLMNYFNSNIKIEPLSKEENMINSNINKNKINLSSIYIEYINNQKDNINESGLNISFDNKNKSKDNIYLELINKKLNVIKNEVIAFLNEIKNKIGESYSNFANNISTWLKKKDKKFTKILSGAENSQVFFNFINENIFKKINKIIEIHDLILKSIKDQFNILNNFLGDNNLIRTNCPIEEFLLKNSELILKSWLLSKINMEELSLTKFLYNKDLSDLFKNYYSKKIDGKLFKSILLKNDNKGNYSYEPIISRYNFVKINKLKIKSMSNDNLNKIYKKIIGKNDINTLENKNKIKSISLSNLDLFNSSSETIIKFNFPYLERLKIKKCLIPYNFQNIFQSYIGKTNNLKSIKIEYIKLNDKSLNDFISYITKNKSIISNIQDISFKGNKLNSINFQNLIKDKIIFNNLEELDLSNNNIYNFFSSTFRIFPKLLVLDLSNNNINNNLLFEGIRKSKNKKLINFISFMSQNIFLYNVNDNNKKYIKYLNENLINFNYKIKYINLSLLYNKENREDIIKLIFSPIIRLSLIRLDLSYCGLNDIFFSGFLKNNFDLISLTHLNLNNNFFTIKFFSLCSSLNNNNENENILLEKIKVIDLSFNNIKYKLNNDLIKLIKFIENHSHLEKIKLNENDLLSIFKKTDNKEGFKNEINKLVNLCGNRNFKFIIQAELLNSIDNEIYRNIFVYKN